VSLVCKNSHGHCSVSQACGSTAKNEAPPTSGCANFLEWCQKLAIAPFTIAEHNAAVAWI
jgi:hypothetical protein